MINTLGYARCECHECTQARWKMSGTQQMATKTTTPDPGGYTYVYPSQGLGKPVNSL